MATRKPAPTAPNATTTKPKRALPPALVENARALRALGQARLRARGEAAIELIRDKLADLAENVFEIGQALGELTIEGVAGALGFEDFEDICRRALNVAPTTARRWMTLATRLDRRFVLEVGADRARALLELADATPEQVAEPRALLTRTLTLPSGEKLVVKRATNAALDGAAKAFRQARASPEGRKRGFTTTPAEQKAHQAIAKRLAKAPANAHASTRLIAQRDADGAKVVLEVRLSAWAETLALLTGK